MDLRNAVDVDGHSVRDDKALQTGTGKPESPVRSSPQSSRLARYQMASALARLWKFELAAATFSLVAIAGIIITLAASDGKPLDDWHSVPPNIIVAFLAALVQLSFGAVLAESISQLKWIHFQEPHKLTDLQLFDEASRSRFGAVKLLLVKHRHVSLMTVAATISVAALLLEPFVQLTLTFPLQPQNMLNAAPTFMQTQYYKSSDPISLSGQVIEARPEMQSHILSGIFNTSLPPVVSCTQGNCTWPSIASLGACSVCVKYDTVLADSHRSCIRYQTKPDFIWFNCTYSFPEVAGVKPWRLVANFFFDQSQDSIWLQQYTLWNSTTAAGSANESSDLLQDSTKMIDVNFIKFPPLSGSQSSETFVIPPLQQASHCSINLCARTYQNLSSVNGNFTFAWGPPARLKVRNVDQNTAPAGSDWLVFDPEVDAKIPPGFNNTFGISGLTAGEISGYLIELFNVAYTSSGTSLSNDPESSSYGDIFQTDRVAPIVTKVFNNTNDITRLMEQISQGITEAMRGGSNDEGESHAIVGTATHMVTVIKVRWAYLALPVVLTVVALVLLIIVILQTKSSGTMPWKSSCLGLLFHELSGWDDIKHNVNGQDDARRYADGMTAQIDATVGRPAFVNANALYNS